MKGRTKQEKHFTRQLMHWHGTENQRQLPWKEEKDPYKIWLSEIIMQQTRAQQGLPYYNKFIGRYPTVDALAAAEDEAVFRIWQGLGYYNRCKNLLATARHIVQEHGSRFPPTYAGLLALKGIGSYTAAAIASFAFGLPYAVVDGNVYRVLGRYFGIETPYDTGQGKKLFQQLAETLLDKDEPAAYNQAIMDFGATVCTPKSPKCGQCPLEAHCFARKHEAVHLFPVRSKKQTVSQRYFHYILLDNGTHIWVRKRVENDIWQNLHEPLLIEHEQPLSQQELKEQLSAFSIEPVQYQYHDPQVQRLTHQLITFVFYTVTVAGKPKVPAKEGLWVEKNELKNIGFPRTIASFLEKNLYF